MSDSSNESTYTETFLQENFGELIQKHCPVFYFHRDEKYYPSSVEYMIYHSGLLFHTKDSTGQVVKQDLFEGKSFEERLQILSTVTPSGRDPSYRFATGVHSRPGFPPSSNEAPGPNRETMKSDLINSNTKHSEEEVPQEATGSSIKPSSSSDAGSALSLDHAPIYVRFRPLKGDKEAFDIVYNVFCPYNGPEVRLGCINAGIHDNDWEHITCRFRVHESSENNNENNNNKKLTASLACVYYGAHGDTDGQWLHKEHNSIEFYDSEKNRPVVYCAYYSHAMYPKEKIWWTACGLANDYAGKGHKWDPVNNIVNIHSQSHGWMIYRGLWSPNGIDSLVDKGYYYNEWSSSNSWYRRCCCCWLDSENCMEQHDKFGNVI